MIKLGIKITKKLLNDYVKYKREIPLLKKELEEMKTTEAGLGSSTIFDYSTGYPRPQSVVGFDWDLYDRRKKTLENKCLKVEAVEEWIGNIKDIRTRIVFKRRYIDRKSWVAIAKEIGYGGNVDYPRLYIRDKYLKENEIF